MARELSLQIGTMHHAARSHGPRQGMSVPALHGWLANAASVLFHGVSIPAAVHKLMLVDSGEDIKFLLRFRPVPDTPPVPAAPFALNTPPVPDTPDTPDASAASNPLPTPTDKPPHGA